MKILTLSESQNRGGAAKAAYRFCKEFYEKGHDVKMFVNKKSFDDDFTEESDVIPLIKKVHHTLDYLPSYVLSGFSNSRSYPLGLWGQGLSNSVRKFEPDIINVHWVWKGFLSFYEIVYLSRSYPVFWRLADESAYSGGLFFSDPKVTKYLHNTNPFLEVLASLNILFRNSILTGQERLHFITPSEYVKERFLKSHLGDKFPVTKIYNGIDTSVFSSKRDRNQLRKKFGFDLKKKYILIGALSIIKDRVKGAELLTEILSKLSSYMLRNNVGIITYGEMEQPFNIDNRIEQRNLGYIGEEDHIASIFATSDVFLLPSFIETFSFTTAESLSSGTPVVAFNVGGPKELIRHNINGYLAKPYSVDDFAIGVKSILEKKRAEFDVDLDIRKQAGKCLKLFSKTLS